MVQRDDEKAPTSEPSEQSEGDGRAVLGAASKWYTCSICLEETFDDDVRSHLQCGGIICTGCLTTMLEFYGRDNLTCPVINDYFFLAN